MNHSRRRLVGAVAGVSVVAAIASVAVWAAPSGNRVVGAIKATVIVVTVGKPSEFTFKLSKSSLIGAGPVTFKVTNKGKFSHDFKLCAAAVTSAAKNACSGKVTPLLAPGKSATLTLTLKKGEYEFLCAVPGHAKEGLKGLLAVGEKLVIPTSGGGTTTPGTTTPATTTPHSSGSTTLPPFPTGNGANGKTLFTSTCGGCHTLTAAGTDGGIPLDGTGVTLSFVEGQVYNGGGGMPAFGGQLSPQQIADLATFVSANSN